MTKTENLEERSFSIELKNKQNLKNVTLNNRSDECVLLEGTIGELKTASFVAQDILEVVGSQGVLRVNVAKQEIIEAKQP
jgi:hypothetical protein